MKNGTIDPDFNFNRSSTLKKAATQKVAASIQYQFVI